MRRAIQRGDPLGLAQALVAVDSRNPSLVDGAPGEGACARLLAGVLREWGFSVELQKATPARPNVVARIGTPGSRTLMFNGHLDTVGVEGMTHAPWDAGITDARLFGRGAADMKGGVAAMCAAAWRLGQTGVEGEIIVAAVVDEEYQSLGTRTLIDAGVRADAAIVTEPTRLAVAPAHKGFVWADLDVRGVAAHGSRYDVGVDAIAMAALVIAELERYQQEELARNSHPLLGRPSLHASIIKGGSGLSTYPDRCVVQLERRTLPGERASVFVAEVEAAIGRVRSRRPELDASVVPGFSQEPNAVDPSHPIVAALSDALVATGGDADVQGLSCWTDAALLSAAGIPAVCFGPGDIAVAHAAEEYVPVDEITRATTVLERAARTWFAAR